MTKDVLGIPITTKTKSEIRKSILSLIKHKESGYVCTANPEIVLHAYRDKAYADILKASHINICDGFGLQIATGFTSTRYTGIELVQDLLHISEKKGYSIYLLGSSQKNNTQATKMIKANHPNIIIAGHTTGPQITYTQGGGITCDDNEKTIEHIREAEPDIILVAFGHPKQEYWIAKYLSQLPSVHVAIGVGGTLDVLSGNVKRAPLLLRGFIGFEWLWRLCMEPRRFMRIWRAVIIFPIVFIYYQIKSYVKQRP